MRKTCEMCKLSGLRFVGNRKGNFTWMKKFFSESTKRVLKLSKIFLLYFSTSGRVLTLFACMLSNKFHFTKPLLKHSDRYHLLLSLDLISDIIFFFGVSCGFWGDEELRNTKNVIENSLSSQNRAMSETLSSHKNFIIFSFLKFLMITKKISFFDCLFVKAAEIVFF